MTQNTDRNALTEQLYNLLKNDDTPQSVFNEMLSSMVIVQSRDMQALMSAYNRQEKKLDDVLRQLNGLNKRIEKLDDLPQRMYKIEEYLEKNPTLVWLMRYETRKTALAIIVIFLVLSLWYVSGLRQPMLSLFGLPVF